MIFRDSFSPFGVAWTVGADVRTSFFFVFEMGESLCGPE